MLEGTWAFGQGNNIAAHRCQRIVNPKIDATTHGTGSWLARPNIRGVMGKYPSVSGRGMNWCLPPWHEVLPPIQRGTLATCWRVALYLHCTKWVNAYSRNQNQEKPELHNSQSMRMCSPKTRGMCGLQGIVMDTLPLTTNCDRQYC